MDTKTAHSDQIKTESQRLGFDACGIAEAGNADPEGRFAAWLAQGYHADMVWMATTADVRKDVREKLPEARSVVVVARNYYQDTPETTPDQGRIARYALGRDYHKVMKKPLTALARFIDTLQPGSRSYCCIDTGPVLERYWAAKSGIGWVGKNSLILNREQGSWFLLGVIITPVVLTPDTPQDNHCGSCSRCMEACPTGAIVAPGIVDSRKCISYHTIENRGDIPAEFHDAIGNRIFGCDDCQDVCPWNRMVAPTTEAAFTGRDGVVNPSLEELRSLDKAAFDSRFAGTPVRRATYAGFMRNLRIACRQGNS